MSSADLLEVYVTCFYFRSHNAQMAKEYVEYLVVVWVFKDTKCMIRLYLIMT